MNTIALSKFSLQHLLIGVFMLAAAGLAYVLTPKAKVADQVSKIDLESIIPKQFGDWRVDESIIPLQVSPDVQAQLDKLYSETLARTYVNQRGERVMLSIAYGGTQNKQSQVHLPEVCYPAQGFQIKDRSKSTMDIGRVAIPVMRLVAYNGQRTEPITYWIRLGNRIVRGSLEQKLATVQEGLQGNVADGLLFRVSSISSDAQQAYSLQDRFVVEMLSTLSKDHYRFLLGSQLADG